MSDVPLEVANPIESLMADLSTCLCSQIISDGLPSLCFCGVVPGNAVALDYVGECDDEVCGMAWVRLMAAYPASTIGQASTRPGNCSTGIGIDVEIGIIRCFDAGDGQTPPDPAELTAAAALANADMLAMWRAVSCCRRSKDFVIGSYVPYGPEGGVYGGILPASILVL